MSAPDCVPGGFFKGEIMKYRNKKTNEIVEAYQWFENGDHPRDDVWRIWEDGVYAGEKPTEPREGKVVRYFRHPMFQGGSKCHMGCGFSMHRHGWIDNSKVFCENNISSLEYSMVVCPGDYIISHYWAGKVAGTPPKRTYYPMRRKEFEKMCEEYKEPIKKDDYTPKTGSGIVSDFRSVDKILAGEESARPAVAGILRNILDFVVWNCLKKVESTEEIITQNRQIGKIMAEIDRLEGSENDAFKGDGI